MHQYIPETNANDSKAIASNTNDGKAINGFTSNEVACNTRNGVSIACITTNDLEKLHNLNHIIFANEIIYDKDYLIRFCKLKQGYIIPNIGYFQNIFRDFSCKSRSPFLRHYWDIF